MDIYNFEHNVRNGDVEHKSGYHQPDSYPHYQPSCGCTKTTPKGAYRDVTVVVEDRLIHYYHQTPVVVNHDGVYSLQNGGWETRTTRERMSGYLPSGYSVIQRDHDWYVTLPNGGQCEYRDGMAINLREARIAYRDGSYIDVAKESAMVEVYG